MSSSDSSSSDESPESSESEKSKKKGSSKKAKVIKGDEIFKESNKNSDSSLEKNLGNS